MRHGGVCVGATAGRSKLREPSPALHLHDEDMTTAMATNEVMATVMLMLLMFWIFADAFDVVLLLLLWPVIDADGVLLLMLLLLM